MEPIKSLQHLTIQEQAVILYQVAEFVEVVSSDEETYMKQIQEFKSNLPEELQQEFEPALTECLLSVFKGYLDNDFELEEL